MHSQAGLLSLIRLRRRACLRLQPSHEQRVAGELVDVMAHRFGPHSGAILAVKVALAKTNIFERASGQLVLIKKTAAETRISRPEIKLSTACCFGSACAACGRRGSRRSARMRSRDREIYRMRTARPPCLQPSPLPSFGSVWPGRRRSTASYRPFWAVRSPGIARPRFCAWQPCAPVHGRPGRSGTRRLDAGRRNAGRA